MSFTNITPEELKQSCRVYKQSIPKKTKMMSATQALKRQYCVLGLNMHVFTLTNVNIKTSEHIQRYLIVTLAI